MAPIHGLSGMSGTQPGERTRTRVAFVLPSFAGGGAERVIITFANALPRDRFQVALVVLNDEGPLHDLVEDHVRLHVIGVPRVSRALPQLLRLLRRLRADVVMSSIGQVNVALLASRWLLPRGTRVAVREANLPSLILPRVRFRWVFAAGYRWLYPRADVVFATSQRMRDELIELGSAPSQVKVLPNPVDVDRIRALADPPTRVPGEGRRFVAVGRLVHQKGFDLLLPVFAQLPDEDHLTILGEGPERSALEDQARSLGIEHRVSMPGFTDNPWTCMAGADALVMPSRTEGMPNAALEALACGTRVIATPESGGILEFARDVSADSVVFGPVSRFSDLVVSLKASPRDAMSGDLCPPICHLQTATHSLGSLLTQDPTPDGNF